MIRTTFKKYNPYYLARQDEKQVRKEYSKLKKALKQRLSRMKGTHYTEGKQYKRLKNLVNKNLRNLSYKDVLADISDIVHYGIYNPLTTKRGYAKHVELTLEGLHKNNYDFVTEENLEQFSDFMEDMKEAAYSLMLSSDQLADAWYDTITGSNGRERHSEVWVRENFEKWAKHESELRN